MVITWTLSQDVMSGLQLCVVTGAGVNFSWEESGFVLANGGVIRDKSCSSCTDGI